MSAKGILGAMVAGSALVIVAVSRPEPPPLVLPPEPPHEAPWLTREAAAEIIGPGGTLGPLFSELELGGPAPSAATRARIAAFARANHVEIDLDVSAGELVAVRFAVTYGGCCGYEGADVLALALRRPRTQSCCGCETGWIDDWASVSDDGSVHMRARVRVNRVAVRWERTLTLRELLERADGLLGADPVAVGTTARGRWLEIEPGRRYVLEVPYPFMPALDVGSEPRLADRDDLGFQVAVERGRISEVTFTLRDFQDEPMDLEAAVRSRWGRPRVDGDETWTWRRPDRIVTADIGAWSRIAIRARSTR